MVWERSEVGEIIVKERLWGRVKILRLKAEEGFIKKEYIYSNFVQINNTRQVTTKFEFATRKSCEDKLPKIGDERIRYGIPYEIAQPPVQIHAWCQEKSGIYKPAFLDLIVQVTWK